MNLDGKVIVVTGAAQGLGRAMVAALGEKGAIVVGIDRNQECLGNTHRHFTEQGVTFHAYQADISEESSVQAVFGKIYSDLGRIDGLVNNAGIVRDGLFLKVKEGKVVDKMSLENWQMVIDVNLTGVFLCTREAAALMIDNKQTGAIVNISSVSRHGNMGQTNYTAAKAGVAGMTVTWAKELIRYGIRVGGISPGYIGTDMVKSMKPEALEKIANQIPAKRLGEPSEIAQAVVFILENDYFNGRMLDVDGGLRI